MICKPYGEKKSEVCFTQVLSGLNSNMLRYEKLLLYICRGVCMCEHKDTAPCTLWIFPSKTVFKPDCTLYKCKLSTLPPLCFLSLICPSPACLPVEVPARFRSGLQPVRRLQCGQRTSETDAFAENHLANLMAPSVSLPCVSFVFPYPNQLNE